MLTGMEFNAREAVEFGLADNLVENKDALDDFL